MVKQKRRAEEPDEPSNVYDKLLGTFSNNATKELRRRIIEESKPEEEKLSVAKPSRKKRKLFSKTVFIDNTAPVHIDPFATVSEYKSFTRNKVFVDTNSNDTESAKYDKFKVAIDFARKENDTMHQFLNKPRTEEDIGQMVRDFEAKKSRYVHLHTKGDAIDIDPVYDILGKKIEANIARELPKPMETLDHGRVERDIIPKWEEYLHDTGVNDPFRNDFQRCMFTLFNDYRDVYYPHITSQNRQSIVESYVLHAVNHILKKKRYNWYNDKKREVVGEEHYQVKDQGYNAPTVLFIVPFRRQALEIVQIMLALMPKLLSTRRDEAFELTFSDIDELESDDEETEKKDKNADKPSWYQEIFKGNTDDDFSLGMTLHEYHGQFEIMSKVQGSDIIIATPVGIQRENLNDKYEKIFSSIELCIVDQSDVILMQNWEHLVTVFDKLMNKSPTQSNAFHYDFTKIRDYFVYGFGQYFRQTIILSRFASPDINGLLNYCYNVRGQVKIRTKFAQGIITSVHGSIPQIFERFDCDQPSRIDDARFEYFKTQVYPRMKQSSDGIFLILVSTYLDFVRIRNFFDEDHVPFFGVSEYSENARNVLSKHRAQGSTANYLLYTERHYYFHAPRLKDFKVNQIVFYTLPENDFVYRSFATRGVSLLQKFENCRVLSLFCKYDALKLERVVGTKRCQTLIHSETNTHLFDNN